MARATRADQRDRRRRRVRKHVRGTPDRPRLNVYRSLRHVYAQVIDDTTGRVLCAASTQTKDVREAGPSGGTVEAAGRVGAALADRAKAAGVSRVVFDRNGFRYHGRVKALADAAREHGLEF